jgi:hypothetical protein
MIRWDALAARQVTRLDALAARLAMTLRAGSACSIQAIEEADAWMGL